MASIFLNDNVMQNSEVVFQERLNHARPEKKKAKKRRSASDVLLIPLPLPWCSMWHSLEDDLQAIVQNQKCHDDQARKLHHCHLVP
jgi:hypothetical protein